MGRRPKQTFPQRRYIDGQQKYEKILNMANCKRNTNQNYNEIQPHSSQNGHHTKKSTNNKCYSVCGEKKTLLPVGGNVSRCSHYGAQCGDSSENYKQTYRMIQQFHSCADKIIIQKSSK